jgi:hypothetical protein
MEGRRLKDVLRATMLALLGVVALAPAAPAQISFEMTGQLPGSAGDLRMPLLTAKASVPDISGEELLGRRTKADSSPREPTATPARATVEPWRPLELRESGPPPVPPPPPDRARPLPLDASTQGLEPLPLRPRAMSLVPPGSGIDVDWVRFVATLVLGAGTLSLFLLTRRGAPRSAAARVAHQLADRRREVTLLGGVMLMGVAVGYLTAVFAG